MEAALEKYLESIKANYRAFSAIRKDLDPIQQKIVADMIEEFESTLRVDEGNKYLKVVCRNSVHSFILTKDDGKFRKGDVLKAASWAAPARNFVRGNILDGTANPTWTGVA